ncbi:RNA 3'-terminal phosphate cyclase [Pendulispora brunnea]|uniref:RNA 3'-terminal phosphate cyclase n=1 Tax=Pendulispora brunnea TaxID=2905690 RepID=A0ABZ2KDK6_9BACT
MLTIDGSMGEGGGQLLRSSLALSLLTSTPFQITKIRAGRARPGLMRQHLAAVHAATEIGRARTEGAAMGSTELTFHPNGIHSGDYTFAIGGAGSTTLVFQTILLPLLLGGKAPSTLTFEGGTHNPMAPPFDFLERTFLPVLATLGARVDIRLERHGFYPAGGGVWTATVHPTTELAHLELLHRGEVRARHATALIAQIAPAIALRELDTLCNLLSWEREDSKPTVVRHSHGPGNALLATIACDHVIEVITGFGERGVRAETVAEGVAREVARYLAANVPVGEHLADQLLLPMALGAGGTIRTVKPSMHCLTQIELVKMFLGLSIRTTEEAPDVWRIDVPSVVASRKS